jgi:hypothetical protein
MKTFMFIAALTICGLANDCFAGERQRGVKFKCVTPCDVLRGTGYFIQDTGRNTVGGVRTTVKGLGELITAPFRAKILIPQRRFFYYTPPRFFYKPGKLREIKPPTFPLSAPAPPEVIRDLRYFPEPSSRYVNLT